MKANTKSDGEGVPQRRRGAEEERETDPVVMRKVFWVDVRDHLPDDEMTVLVWDGEREEMFMGFRLAGEWYEVDSAIFLHSKMLVNITHWADLPEGPKEGL